MNINERQKQININIQKKANLIWNSATHIYGLYKEHEYGKVILPFTVLKRFDDEPNIEYTEANMNIGVDGKPINTDKKFRKEFRSDRYNILVVANKYQTGFDEPLLHSMYVDKRLKGVNAVQTLSRLNRIATYKTDTLVLDFENKADDIKVSFQPFYEGIVLVGDTDYNKVYDLRAMLKEFMLYNSDVVDKFFNKLVESQAEKKQDNTGVGKLTSLLKPVVERYNDLDENERYKFKDYVRKFNKNYSYITQLIRIHDEELFKEYQFTSHLIMLLPKNKKELINIDDKIKLEYAQLKESFTGQIKLDKQSVDVKPSGAGEAKKPNKKDTLESIVDKVNEKYSGNFTDGDRVIIEGIFNMFMNDDEVSKYKKLAKNNPEMFVKSLFPEKFQEIVTRCYLENNESFKKLFNDPEFYKNVMEQMAKELYKSLRK